MTTASQHARHYVDQHGSHGPFRIVPQICTRRLNARRGHPAVEAGTLLYCIELERGKFFDYSYLSEEYAKQVMRLLTQNGVIVDANVARDPITRLPTDNVDDTRQCWTGAL